MDTRDIVELKAKLGKKVNLETQNKLVDEIIDLKSQLQKVDKKLEPLKHAELDVAIRQKVDAFNQDVKSVSDIRSGFKKLVSKRKQEVAKEAVYSKESRC